MFIKLLLRIPAIAGCHAGENSFLCGRLLPENIFLNFVVVLLFLFRCVCWLVAFLKKKFFEFSFLYEIV